MDMGAMDKFVIITYLTPHDCSRIRGILELLVRRCRKAQLQKEDSGHREN